MERLLGITVREHLLHSEARLLEPSLEGVPGGTNAVPDSLTREVFLGEGRTCYPQGWG